MMATFDLARNITSSVGMLLDVHGSEHLRRGAEVDVELQLTFDGDGGVDRYGHARIDVEFVFVRDLGVGDDLHHDPRVSYQDGTRS
jgi:hypothetical protein